MSVLKYVLVCVCVFNGTGGPSDVRASNLCIVSVCVCACVCVLVCACVCACICECMTMLLENCLIHVLPVCVCVWVFCDKDSFHTIPSLVASYDSNLRSLCAKALHVNHHRM
jgi:hypothetical protein